MRFEGLGLISNGEFDPLPQTEKQGQFEARMQDLADTYGKKLGMDRREFLRSSCGMAAAFLALNDVFGPVFTVDQAEAADPEVVLARAEGLKHQFIFDAQTHFVRDDFMHEEALGTAQVCRHALEPCQRGTRSGPPGIVDGQVRKLREGDLRRQ